MRMVLLGVKDLIALEWSTCELAEGIVSLEEEYRKVAPKLLEGHADFINLKMVKPPSERKFFWIECDIHSSSGSNRIKGEKQTRVEIPEGVGINEMMDLIGWKTGQIFIARGWKVSKDSSNGIDDPFSFLRFNREW